MISIVAASVKRAVANSCAKMPRGPKFHVARNNIQDSRTDLLPSRGGIKGTEKKCNPPPKLPGSHRYHADRKANALLPPLSDHNSPLLAEITVTNSSTNIPTDEFYGRPASSRLHRSKN